MWINPGKLSNETLRLEPMKMSHAEGLSSASELENYQYWQTLVPKGESLEDFKIFMEKLLALPNCLPMVMIDPSSDEVIGMSCFMDIREIAKGLEIGMTWIRGDKRGTIINPSAKILMLEYAFETAKAIRVQLKTDERNIHSQNAIKKLGGKYEGTLRHHGIQPNGYIRNTVMFSILAEEWPEVKAKLRARISS